MLSLVRPASLVWLVIAFVLQAFVAFSIFQAATMQIVDRRAVSSTIVIEMPSTPM